MKIIMDSDCLIKLTKGGSKEKVIMAMEVHIPFLVKKETVDEVKNRGYQDAFIIEENIGKKALKVVKNVGNNDLPIPVLKGEKEVISIFLNGGYDAIASDDRRFLKKLDAAKIPYLTPTACIIYLYKNQNIGKEETLNLLESIKPFISKEEYLISKFYLGEK